MYDRNIINQHPDSDVYELTWPQENAAGKMENIKWRMFLAVNSNKIKRSDVYKKSSPDEQYKLEGLAVISYLQKEEIKTIIQNNFDLIRSEPVHRPTGI